MRAAGRQGRRRSRQCVLLATLLFLAGRAVQARGSQMLKVLP